MSRDREYSWGIQTKLSLASGLLVLISLASFGVFSYSVVKGTLDDQTGEKLASHAKMIADTLPKNWLRRMPIEDGMIHQDLIKRLAAAKDAANLDKRAATNLDNVVLIGPGLKNRIWESIIWADANDKLSFGEPHWAASADQTELALVWAGNVAISPLYADGKDKYKSAYAPVISREGKVVAVLRVEASAEFLNITNRVGFILLASALGITAVAALIGMLIARSIVIPIKELVRASQNVAGGALDTEVVIESGDEIGFFARTFNQMTRNLRKLYEEVEERGRQIAELSASVAHEVRSPISAIQGFTELLEDDMDDDDPGQEYIADIKSEVRILNAKVTDFMDFARPLELDLIPMDIAEVLESALVSMDKEATDGNVGIVTNFGPDLPIIQGDFARLRGLFVNLIRNAIQAMEDGGGLIISANPSHQSVQNTETERSFVEVRIEDTGCGMDPGAQEHAFEPFFTTKGSGTGLGLAIVKKIVDAHRGRIELDSEVEQGTIVKVFLPINRDTELDV